MHDFEGIESKSCKKIGANDRKKPVTEAPPKKEPPRRPATGSSDSVPSAFLKKQSEKDNETVVFGTLLCYNRYGKNTKPKNCGVPHGRPCVKRGKSIGRSGKERK